MNAQDGAVYDGILRNVMAPANHESIFIKDLEGLNNLVRAAELQFQASKKDAVDSGGDGNAVGQTFSKMSLDKRTSLGVVTLNAISEAFPSEYVQQLEQKLKSMLK